MKHLWNSLSLVARDKRNCKLDAEGVGLGGEEVVGLSSPALPACPVLSGLAVSLFLPKEWAASLPLSFSLWSTLEMNTVTKDVIGRCEAD